MSSWSAPNLARAQWNPAGMAMQDMNSGSFSPEQWALIQQQNWQQWTQWQQQFSQWQNQYGDEYAQQLQAVQSMGSIPPPPPSGAVPPPPPDKPPPPPPHENNQPLFNSNNDKSSPSNPLQQRNPSNFNTNTGTGNNNRSYSTDNQQQPAVNAEDLKKLTEEERLFDIQFQKWEGEIDKWRQENGSHPDKQAYKDYEAKFEACRKQLLERRQLMKMKRASLLDNPQAPAKSTGNTSVAPPPSKSSNQNIYSQNLQSQNSQNNNYERQYESSQSSNIRNKNIEPEDRCESHHQNVSEKKAYSSQENHELQHDKSDNSSFLPTQSTKGIPGLDLAPDSHANKKQDVIDLSDDDPKIQNEKATDYSTISMKINNILGDEKIMNILRGLKPAQETETGNATQNTVNNDNPQFPPSNQGNRNENFMQPQQYGDRQNSMPNRQGQFSQQNQDMNSQFQPPNYNKQNRTYQDKYNQYGGSNSGGPNMSRGPHGPGGPIGPRGTDPSGPYGLGMYQGGPGMRPSGPGMRLSGPGMQQEGPGGMRPSRPGMQQGGSVGMRPSGPVGMGPSGPGGMRPGGPGMQQGGPGGMRPSGPGMQQGGPGGMRPSGPSMQQGGPGGMRPSGPGMQQGGPGSMRPSGPGMQQGGPGSMRPSGPGMQQGGPGSMRPNGPGMHLGGPSMRQCGPNMQQSGPNMQQGGPNMHQGGPNMQQGGLDMNQGGPNMQLGGPNIHLGGPNMHLGGPNMHLGGPNMHLVGANMHQVGPNMQQGGPNLHQGSPNMQQGGPNMNQGGPNIQQGGLNMNQGGPNMQQGGLNMNQGDPNMQQPQPLMANRISLPILPNNVPERSPLQDVSLQQNTDFYSGPQRTVPVTQQPKPKWVEVPLFTPSIVVEYEHKSLRLKARDFIEPVHTFDYNHISKDDEFKKKDFEREADELFTRKPRRSERDYAEDRFRDQGNRDLYQRDYERRGHFRDMPRDIREIRGEVRDMRELRDMRDFRDMREPRDIRGEPRDMRELRNIRGESRDARELRDFKDLREPRDARREELKGFRETDRFKDDLFPRDRPRDESKDEIERRRDDRKRDDLDRYGNRRVVHSHTDNRDRDSIRDRRDARRDDRDIRRDENRMRSTSKDKDSRKRGSSRDSDVSSHTKKPKDAVAPTNPIVMIDDLLEPPGRSMRPEKIAIIIRGLPGSGKSYLAKLIRDREAEYGGAARIMSIDDYFMQEGEIEETDPTTGKTVKKQTLTYEYDAALEESYLNSLKRAFKRSLNDGYFSFLIYDAINPTLQSYADIWNNARQSGFQVYICTMEHDVQACFKRNIHGRSLNDIEAMFARFFTTPAHHIRLDATTLLQSAAITDVHMEDADGSLHDRVHEEQVESVFTSKWEKMDDANKLARLDGTSKPLRPSQLSMEEYLQLDDWTPSVAKPGKKTVRWADIEERRQQEKMRAIGFVVGQTDWNRMTDPTMGSSALTQTKYIERTKRS